MAGEITAPQRAPLSGRVWLVLLCAAIVVVFLAVVTPGVFDVRHKSRSLEIKKPVRRLVLDFKGMGKVEIKPSRDGHVHFLRKSEVSRDSRLVERIKVSGKTLTIHSACTGSRLGVLRRCDLSYHLRVPRKIALALRVHFGDVTVTGTRGRLDFRSDAGSFHGSVCSKRANIHLGFGQLKLRDTCVPELIHARVRGGHIGLTVPAGRYDVHAKGGAKRPFENIIEDPASPDKIDAAITWGGSIDIEGVNR
jgi:hypothetical protein